MAVRSTFRSQLSLLSTWGRGLAGPITALVVRVGRRASEGRQIRPRPLGRELVAGHEWNLRGKRSRAWGRREKPRGRWHLTVPQTDTGRQVEDTKAFERTLVKELGNLAP